MKKKIDNLNYMVKILWEFDKWIFLLFAGSIITGTIVPHVGILLPKYVIQALLNQANASQWVSLLLVFGLGGTCIYVINVWFLNLFKAHIKAARNGCFGQMLTDKMMKMKYSLLEEVSIQDLCYRANFLFWSDNSGMAGTFDNLRVILAGIFTISSFTVMLVNLNPILPVLLIVLFLFSFKCMISARKKESGLRNEVAKTQRERDYLNSVMCDIVAGKDIRLYGMTGWLSGWYRRMSRCGEKAAVTIGRSYMGAELCAAVISFVRDVAVYLSLFVGVMGERIAVDDFVLYIGVVSGFTTTLITIVDKFLGVRRFLEYVDDFQEVMSLEEDTEREKNETVRDFQSISLRNVSFRYSKSSVDALNKINLTINKGDHIAIVGRNGAGKTTLIKLLLGLYAPSFGEIEIESEDGEKLINEKCYKLFSVVMQRIFQYAFTMEENITFRSHEHIDEVRLKHAVEVSELSEEIEKLPHGLKTPLRKDYNPEGITLSGGQAQKLALARAFYRDAPIVILDEPSSALDPIAEYRLYESVNRLLKDKTCIFISHRLSSVRFCNRIVLLEQGGIVGCGSHEELMKKSALYNELWEAQSKPYREQE